MKQFISLIDQTVSARVTDRLRDDIVNGRIPSGGHITIKDISERYGVSAMPVREAFQSLKGEQFLDIIPYKGAMIREIDKSFVADFYEVRSLIEPYLLERACQRSVPPERIFQMERIMEKFETVDLSTPVEVILKMNSEFHECVYMDCDNKQLLYVYTRFSGIIQSLRKRYGFSMERLQEMKAEHHEILNALKGGNVLILRALIIHHMGGAKVDLLRLMQL